MNESFKEKTQNITFITIIIVAIFLMIAGYAGYKLFSSMSEPEINISAMENNLSSIDEYNNIVVSTPKITIKGSVSDITHFTANGDTVYLDENGNFTHTLILHEGINYIKFVAKDKFGRKTEKEIKIIYKPIKENVNNTYNQDNTNENENTQNNY